MLNVRTPTVGRTSFVAEKEAERCGTGLRGASMVLEATRPRIKFGLISPELLRVGSGPNKSDDGVIREGVRGASSAGIADLEGPAEEAARFESCTPGFRGVIISVNPSGELTARPVPKRRIRCRPVDIPGSDTDFDSCASPSTGRDCGETRSRRDVKSLPNSGVDDFFPLPVGVLVAAGVDTVARELIPKDAAEEDEEDDSVEA